MKISTLIRILLGLTVILLSVNAWALITEPTAVVDLPPHYALKKVPGKAL